MQRAVIDNLKETIHSLYGLEVEPVLTRPDAQFGDLATNVALQLAKQVGKKPQDVATRLADAVRELHEVIEVHIAGPGFINIRLHDSVLLDHLGAKNGAGSRRGQVVVIETNNPNPFKDLHIGHAYNCIVADTMANLLDISGAHVHRVSYHGDVGLHVGRSMWAILKWCDGDISKLDTVPEGERPRFMSDRYVEGAKADKEDAAAKKQIEAYAKESFAPEGEYKIVYEKCRDWSFRYLKQTVERLGSKPVEKSYLESQADSVGVKTVREHVGEVFDESGGAIVFAGEAFGLHTRVFIASRGTGLYEARDLGLMQLKSQDFHPSKSYIVTGEEQREYFRVVIKAAELCLPELAGVTENISTGTVKLASGKMSSREGNILNIEWLFSALQDALAERAGSNHDMDMVVGALRYTMLRVRVGSDIVFDIDAALSVEGNSGPYLQYAHARACSIIGKSTVASQDLHDTGLSESERTLVLKLTEYAGVVEQATRELLPHVICTYLYELAQEFNRFYENARVVGDEREAVRVGLVGHYRDTLAAGLSILGIPAPEKL
jgi:arginyl-tRNA synthetase